jgi:hypothetical protein
LTGRLVLNHDARLHVRPLKETTMMNTTMPPGWRPQEGRTFHFLGSPETAKWMECRKCGQIWSSPSEHFNDKSWLQRTFDHWRQHNFRQH